MQSNPPEVDKKYELNSKLPPFDPRRVESRKRNGLNKSAMGIVGPFSGLQRIVLQRCKKRSTWVDYLLAILVQAGLFMISVHAQSESVAIFTLIYLLSAILIAIFLGQGAGVIAGILASISVDYHYILEGDSALTNIPSYVFLIMSLTLVQLVLAALGLLQGSVERAEHEKKRAEDAVSAREEILSIVAHDLRQPLSAISLRSQLMLTDRTRPSSEIEALSGIDTDVKRLDRLIGDLMDVSQIEARQMRVLRRPIVLTDTLNRVIEGFRASHPSRKVEVLSSGQPVVIGDPDRLYQILANLISNAFKYGEVQSKVTVEVLTHSNGAEIIVSNRGGGIPPSQIVRIFERYVRTPEARNSPVGGLGLGLYITKGLVEAQGGRIWAESVLGEVTKFHFTLPISEESPKTNRSSKPIWDGGLARTRILVVDDSDEHLILLKALLEKGGAQVGLAHSVEEAMQGLDLLKPDIVLTDLEMPGDDGFALLRKIRDFKKLRIPVIAISGYSGEKESHRIREAGFDSQITKPISFDRLVAVVHNLTA
jgi:signal transduction histidine kinase